MMTKCITHKKVNYIGCIIFLSTVTELYRRARRTNIIFSKVREKYKL